MTTDSDYLLGVNQTELERLEFQHNVWKKITNDFFDRIGIQKGWRCLDVGSGPGFVSMDLRDRVGDTGEITALEHSEFYLNYFRRETERKGYTNIKFVSGDALNVYIEEDYYDFIFLRWVIDFISEPEKLITGLIRCLKKGGIIAIQDYVYEGILLFPQGGPFDRIADIVRDYWKTGGGDPYFPVKVPGIFKKNDVKLMEFTPMIISGGIESDVIEWAHRFFTVHLRSMAEKQVISYEESQDLLNDWIKHRHSENTIFFSPIVVSLAGAKSES